MNELETTHAGCKFDSIIAEIGSTKSETQQKNTCFEEEDKSTIQAKSELHIATVRFVKFYRNSE